MKTILIIMMATLFPVMATAATTMPEPQQEENHCHDPASWPEWEELLRKNPGDDDVLHLYGLRIGLCILVERGTLTVDQGTGIFEKQRDIVLRKWSQGNEPKGLNL